MQPVKRTSKELDDRALLNKLAPPTHTEPESQPFPPVPTVQVNENDDDTDVIFVKAVAEIDTQPLPKRKGTGTITIADMLQAIFCVSLIGISLFGIVWQVITYPHTLVVLYAREKPTSITTTLPIPTRTLAPVTVTRSATASTTGQGHQDARAASGILTFYNGSANPQYVPVGSVFTGNDGMKVTTDQSITVPVANLPVVGSMAVSARALLPGSQGNIAAYDVDIALSSVLKVRNEVPFTNGRDSRSFKVVAQSDIAGLTSTVNQAVTQAFTTAFPVRQGEAAIPTTCHTMTTPTHQVGEEAQSVTLTTSKTCSALAYDSQELDHQATGAFTQTRPGIQYRIVGQVQTSIVTVSPFTVRVAGSWAFVFTQDDEQLLAEKIAGDTPDQARKALLRTGVIADASISTTLPPAMYINFLVLVGK